VQEQTLMKTLAGFTIRQTACDGAACTLTTAAAWTNAANNGFGHTCFNQDGNHDCSSTYSSGTKFRPTANVAAGDAAETVMASSTPATVTGRIKYRGTYLSPCRCQWSAYIVAVKRIFQRERKKEEKKEKERSERATMSHVCYP
jgi:hypothetical protein